MRILKTLIVAFSIVGAALASSGTISQCNEDYECGVGYPFAACNGGLNVYPGISMDGNDNLIIAGKFNSSQGGPFGLPKMFNIPITSDGSQISERIDIHGEIRSGAGSFNLYSFYDYLPKSNYYYVLMNQGGSAPIFSYIDGNTGRNEVQYVFNVFNTPFVPIFDDEAKSMIYGAYGIYKLNKLPTQRSDAQDATLIYQSQIVNGLAKDGNDLYMSTYDGKFLKGTVDCSNCSKDQLVQIGNDTDAAHLTDFLVEGDLMVFSYSGGIIGYPKSGNGSPIKLVTGENVVSIVSSKNVIYYTTKDGVVKSIGIDGKNGKTLYTPTSNHKCQPAVGYQSTDGVCEGKNLWYNGVPTCTPLTGGVPAQCYTSIDCGPTPYFTCNGKCGCVNNFSGLDCTHCDGNVQWFNGIPSCQTPQ
ncbi:hypothetical protein RB653_010642 [Dictyostelium firmibasis]|uniref:EGF-like domain-containing protein n=1 Tax=Dictyostelium firmibasis TaxID=79012 RepID=A0AAN7TT77_9MYCE